MKRLIKVFSLCLLLMTAATLSALAAGFTYSWTVNTYLGSIETATDTFYTGELISMQDLSNFTLAKADKYYNTGYVTKNGYIGITWDLDSHAEADSQTLSGGQVISRTFHFDSPGTYSVSYTLKWLTGKNAGHSETITKTITVIEIPEPESSGIRYYRIY